MKSIKEIAEEIANDAYKVNSNKFTIARDVERALRDWDKRSDAVIQKIELFQEKYPGQRIDLGIEPDGYCYVTRSDGNGNVQLIAEGATMGDVFEDRLSHDSKTT